MSAFHPKPPALPHPNSPLHPSGAYRASKYNLAIGSTRAQQPWQPEEPPHDILAAEEFAVPALDPELHHHQRVELPADPTGIPGPHDILAAEEFPIPAVIHKPPAG